MNIFEDLVIELKEANLLEETFNAYSNENTAHLPAEDDVLSSDEIHVPDNLNDNRQATHERTELISAKGVEADTPKHSPVPIASPGTAESADLEFPENDETVEIRKPESDREFFKKRAAAEMSSLKMVDAILSAVEREHLKVVPRTYDDLEAKKALHEFMQVADDDTGDAHKAAEFRLLNETEVWCSALAERDRKIPIGHLRVYCETCKPKLSSVAMIAAARFYRNLPYSNNVRSKFDFILTRLFTKSLGGERRELLFTHDQMLSHIKTLYADWSSIPLYAANDEDDANILLTALSLDDLSAESEAARSFDDLIKSDFFGRLRLFKESIAEMYYAPAVTVAAVECNVRVGNRYVELIEQERANTDVDEIYQRYAELDDQTVSEATGRSLGLSNLLRAPAEVAPVEEPVHAEPYGAESYVTEFEAEVESEHSLNTAAASQKAPNRFSEQIKNNIRSVNKYFLGVSLLLVLLSVGGYVWANYFLDVGLPSTGVKTLSFQGTELGDHVRAAKLSGDTLYLVAQPTFATLGKDKQIDVLQQFLKAGSDKGWSKVNIMNQSGQTVGFASPTRTDIYQP